MTANDPAAPPETRPRPLWRDPWFLGIVGIALILRIVTVLLWAHTPPLNPAAPDPSFYWNAAQNIAVGDGYRSPFGDLTAFFPPGYPYFLGGLLSLIDAVGAEYYAATAVGLVQAVLGTAVVIAIVVTGRLLWGRAAGLVAGGIAALWPSLVIYPAAILSESLYLFVFSLFLWFVVRACRTPERSWPWMVGAAILLGVATLVRPQVLLSLPFLVLAWLIAGLGWRRSLAWAGTLAIGVVLIVAPWTIRNQQVFGAFVPLSTNGGANLCIGFGPGAYGGFRFTDECLTGEFYSQGSASELANEQISMARVKEWIGQDPGRLPLLSWNKLRYTFGLEVDAIDGVEVYGYSQVVSSDTREWIYRVSAWFYFPVLALAIVGLVLASISAVRDRRPNAGTWSLIALTLAAMLVPVLFFGDSRFKVPATPMMALFAALTMVLAGRRLTGRTGADIAPTTAVAPAD